MKRSCTYSFRNLGLPLLPILLFLPVACTVYEAPPSNPTSTTYVEAPAGHDDSGYVEIRDDSDFYEPLSSYGRWEEVDTYGRCWIPARVDRDWRPYGSGHWERTDAGWYWDSDEPWGWATYHYGRWDHSDRVGWYWVPQTQWAPAWVSWHQGGGYVGWAPLRPSRGARGDVSIEVTVRDEAPAQSYVFVHEKEFLKPVRPTTVVVNNTTIINQTTNITNVKVVNKTVINEGPHTEVIERATGQKIQSVPARTVRREKEAGVTAPHRATTIGNPREQHAPSTKNPPASVAQPEPVSRPAPVRTPATAPVPPRDEREKNRSDEPRKDTPPNRVPDQETRPERKPEVERKAPVPPVTPKASGDKPAPKAQKPKKNPPKPEHKVEESPGQEKRDAERKGEESREKDKETEKDDRQNRQ